MCTFDRYQTYNKCDGVDCFRNSECDSGICDSRYRSCQDSSTAIASWIWSVFSMLCCCILFISLIVCLRRRMQRRMAEGDSDGNRRVVVLQERYSSNNSSPVKRSVHPSNGPIVMGDGQISDAQFEQIQRMAAGGQGMTQLQQVRLMRAMQNNPQVMQMMAQPTQGQPVAGIPMQAEQAPQNLYGTPAMAPVGQPLDLDKPPK